MSRILAIYVARIGDTLFATPSLRAIAAAHPGAELTFLGHPKRREVIEHLPSVSRVGSITKGMAPWRGWFAGKTYDWAFVWGFDEALISYALRVAHRVVAFRQRSGALNARLYAAVEPPAFQSVHAVDYLLALPRAVGISDVGRRIGMKLTPDEFAWAGDAFSRHIPRGAFPLVGLQVASFPTKAYRDWPVEHFMDLCTRILGAWPGTHFLIFGGTEERVRTEALHRHLGSNSTLFAGRLTLRQTAALMSRLDVYVGVDTGPTHMASAFDLPLVALYHCLSSSEMTGPKDHPLAFVVDHPRPRSACSADTPMSEISVEAVFRQVSSGLAAKRTERHCVSP